MSADYLLSTATSPFSVSTEKTESNAKWMHVFLEISAALKI